MDCFLTRTIVSESLLNKIQSSIVKLNKSFNGHFEKNNVQHNTLKLKKYSHTGNFFYLMMMQKRDYNLSSVHLLFVVQIFNCTTNIILIYFVKHELT